MNQPNHRMRKLLLFCSAILLVPGMLHAQYAFSNISNSGNLFAAKGVAEVVTSTAGNIGYHASSGGVFVHGGPAVATLTVNGTGNVYDAYTGTPSTPGVDSFKGYNNLGSAVEIAGNNAPVFGILALVNGAGNPVSITNTAGIYIGSQMVLSSGSVTTSRSAGYTGAIHFGPGATLTGSSPGDAQYINGYVSKSGTDAFTFPVGAQAGNDLRTLAISAPANAADTIAVAYWNGDPGSVLDPTGGAHSRTALSAAGTAGTTKLTSVSPVGFWDWIPVSGSDAVTITVSMPDLSGTGGYSSPASMRLVGWNTAAGQWENLSGSTGATANTEGSALSGTMTDMSRYSAIGIGNVQTSPLAVKLESFTADIDHACQVTLSWKTASETNMMQYMPQYSTDGKNFWAIGNVTARNNASVYSYNWNGQGEGIGYYRLQLMESDGSYSYSNIVSVYSNCGHGSAITVAPNPAEDLITVNNLTAGMHITVRNTLGQVVQQEESTGSSQQLSMQHLPAGIYVVTVTGTNTVTSVQVVKK